jgi:peptidoglycan hydrolase CwlO-like protein
MCKKIAIVGAAGLLIAAVLTQTHVGGYLRHQFDRADKYLESKVPPEEELARIKTEVGRLDKDIDEARSSLATEIVEVKDLKRKVDDRRTAVETSRAAVEARGKMLKEAGSSKLITWDNNRQISYDRAKELLQAQVKSHKSLETDLKAHETMLAVRERTRDLADQQLRAMVAQKSDLEAAVTELEADIKMAKIEQVQSKYQNDGTRMAEVKESLAKLKKRIEIQREKLALAKQYDPSGAENKTVDEIMAELNAKETPDQSAHK